MKLSVVIPVYNEKATLQELVKRVKAVQIAGVEKELILIDDASKDGSTNLLRTMQQEQPDLKVYFKEVNTGKGASLRLGFEKTTGDYIIVQDADLEYDPQDYKILVEALTKHNAQVVYGSRFSGNYEHMMGLHYIGNKLLTLLTNLLFGVALKDMETCYKLIPGDFVRKLKIHSNRFNFEPEITAKILKSKMRIIEVPISYSGRTFSEGKKITWKDGFSAIYTLVKYRFVD